MKKTRAKEPGLWEAGGVGLLVSLIIGVVSLTFLWATSKVFFPTIEEVAQGERSMPFYLIPAIATWAGAVIALQVYLQGVISKTLYQKRKYAYRSAWNLRAAYPLAAAVYATVVGVLLLWSLLLGYGARLPENTNLIGGGLIAAAGLSAYIVAIGLSLNLANRWSRQTGKLVTLGVAGAGWVLAIGGAVVISLGAGLVGQAERSSSPQQESRQQIEQALKEIARQTKPGYYIKQGPGGELRQCKEAKGDSGCRRLKITGEEEILIGVDDYWPAKGGPTADQPINQVMVRLTYDEKRCTGYIEQNSKAVIIRQEIKCSRAGLLG